MPTDLSKFSIEPFDGTNFATWKWHLVQYFKNEELMDVVLGTRKPKDQEENKINLILAQALKREQLVHIIHKPTPSTKWSHLCAIYESADDSSLQRTAAEFYGLKYEENLDMASFLSNVSMLTTRLEELKKPVDEAMIVAKILASLPASFEMFCVSWSSSPAADKTMANLTSRLLQEEARQLEKSQKTDSSEALFVNRNSRNVFPGTCFNCGQRGHRAVDCRKEDFGGRSQRNGDKSNNGDSSDGSGQCASGAFAFTGIETNAGSGSNSNKWLADSGATRHMCPRKDWFSDLQPCGGLVHVANSVKARIAGKGTIRVLSRGRDINIENVLYVPKLSYSLFSIGVVEKKNCEISIADGILGVSKDGQLLATGRRNGSLYFMDFKPVRRNRNRVNRPWFNFKREVSTRQTSSKSRAMESSNWRTMRPVVNLEVEPPATAEVSSSSKEHSGTSSSSVSLTDRHETAGKVQGDVGLVHKESEEEYRSIPRKVTWDSLAPNANGKQEQKSTNVLDNRMHLAFMSSKVVDQTTSSAAGSNGGNVHLRKKVMVEQIGSLEKKETRVRGTDAVRNKWLRGVKPMSNGTKQQVKANFVTNCLTCSRSFVLEEALMSRFENRREIVTTDLSSSLGHQVNNVR